METYWQLLCEGKVAAVWGAEPESLDCVFDASPSSFLLYPHSFVFPWAVESSPL